MKPGWSHGDQHEIKSSLPGTIAAPTAVKIWVVRQPWITSSPKRTADQQSPATWSPAVWAATAAKAISLGLTGIAPNRSGQAWENGPSRSGWPVRAKITAYFFENLVVPLRPAAARLAPREDQPPGTPIALAVDLGTVPPAIDHCYSGRCHARSCGSRSHRALASMSRCSRHLDQCG